MYRRVAENFFNFFHGVVFGKLHVDLLMFFFCRWTSFVPNNHVPNFLRAGRASITPTVCREISQIKKSLKFRYAGISKLLCVFVLGLFLRFCFHPSVENFYNLCREIIFKFASAPVEAFPKPRYSASTKRSRSALHDAPLFERTPHSSSKSTLHFSCVIFSQEK